MSPTENGPAMRGPATHGPAARGPATNGPAADGRATDGAAPRSAAARGARWRSKGYVVLLTVILAAIAFGTTTQTWLHVALGQSDVQTPDLDVAGSKAATAVTALALVALAGALAVSIAGRIGRVIIAVLIFGSGAGIVSAGLAVLLDPQAAASGSIAKATGVIGGPAQAQTTVFPLIAVIAGALLSLAAIYLVVVGRGWNRSNRFEKAGGAGAGIPPSGSAAAAGPLSGARDAGSGPGLTAGGRRAAGADGPSGSGPEAGGSVADGGFAADGGAPADAEREPGSASWPVGETAGDSDTIDEIDGWDRLSRGNDPTG